MGTAATSLFGPPLSGFHFCYENRKWGHADITKVRTDDKGGIHLLLGHSGKARGSAARVGGHTCSNRAGEGRRHRGT